MSEHLSAEFSDLSISNGNAKAQNPGDHATDTLNHASSNNTATGLAQNPSYKPSTTNFIKGNMTLFTLPAEIRLQIYREVLIEPKPIDLCPLPAATPEVMDNPSFDMDTRWSEGPFLNSNFLRMEAVDKYRRIICPKLALLRTCKQINAEATPVFYGKNEFRFTSHCGWIMANAFGGAIGKHNFSLIRHLTIHVPWTSYTSAALDDSFCEPGGQVYGYDKATSRADVDAWLGALKLKIPASRDVSGPADPKPEYQPHYESVLRCCKWLAEAKTLRTLRLVLPSTVKGTSCLYLANEARCWYNDAVIQAEEAGSDPWEMPLFHWRGQSGCLLRDWDMWANMEKLRIFIPGLKVELLELERFRGWVRPGDPDLPVEMGWEPVSEDDVIPVVRDRNRDLVLQAGELEWKCGKACYDEDGNYPVEDPTLHLPVRKTYAETVAGREHFSFHMEPPFEAVN